MLKGEPSSRVSELKDIRGIHRVEPDLIGNMANQSEDTSPGDGGDSRAPGPAPKEQPARDRSLAQDDAQRPSCCFLAGIQQKRLVTSVGTESQESTLMITT